MLSEVAYAEEPDPNQCSVLPWSTYSNPRAILSPGASGADTVRITVIDIFTVPDAGVVDLDVFDVAGRQVDRLVAGEHMKAGTYRLRYVPSGTTGIYFVRLRVGHETTTSKIVLLK
jgi:hypothetical protein